MVRRLKKRWNIESNIQLILILIVFSITGMATLWVRKAIWPFLGMVPETSLWIKVPMYIIVIFPIYQILQLIIAFIFGQFTFFWQFEKKMFRRIGILPGKKALIASAITLLTVNSIAMNPKNEKVTLGGGCFWCTEAVFLGMKGVETVTPGYSGGHIKNPAYREVITGRTGHAEVIQITFYPEIVTFTEILEVFFMTHDPTTLNRQGADVGTQYRSAIFYHSDEQKKIAEKIAISSLKFNNLKTYRLNDIIFDWERMMSFQGDSSVYLQYTFARFSKILAKSKLSRNFIKDFQKRNQKIEVNSLEKDIIKKIIDWPDIIISSVRNYAPNILANYLLSLADLLNQYYETTPVLQEENLEQRHFRLYLIEICLEVFTNGFNLLGIETLKEI